MWPRWQCAAGGVPGAAEAAGVAGVEQPVTDCQCYCLGSAESATAAAVAGAVEHEVVSVESEQLMELLLPTMVGGRIRAHVARARTHTHTHTHTWAAVEVTALPPMDPVSEEAVFMSPAAVRVWPAA